MVGYLMFIIHLLLCITHSQKRFCFNWTFIRTITVSREAQCPRTILAHACIHVCLCHISSASFCAIKYEYTMFNIS